MCLVFDVITCFELWETLTMSKVTNTTVNQMYARMGKFQEGMWVGEKHVGLANYFQI